MNGLQAPRDIDGQAQVGAFNGGPVRSRPLNEMGDARKSDGEQRDTR
jgi:hypothetical protein